VFKTRAGQLEKALSLAGVSLPVIINHVDWLQDNNGKPRKGCFAVKLAGTSFNIMLISYII
jgi:hypothetical protein